MTFQAALLDALDRAIETFGVKANGGTLDYVPVGGGDSPDLDGIFESPHLALEFGGEIAVSTNAPRLTIRSDAHEAAVGDLPEIDGQQYKVVDVQPDGKGKTVLILEKQ